MVNFQIAYFTYASAVWQMVSLETAAGLPRRSPFTGGFCVQADGLPILAFARTAYQFGMVKTDVVGYE